MARRPGRTSRSRSVPRQRSGSRPPGSQLRGPWRRFFAKVYWALVAAGCVAVIVTGFLHTWDTLLLVVGMLAVLVLGASGMRVVEGGASGVLEFLGLRAAGTRPARQARRISLVQVDRMTGTEFEEHVAALCRRDGCTGIQVNGGAGDLGADVVGRLPDGRALVIQCKRYAPTRSVGSPDMQRFVGTARPVHGADVAILVASCRFTAPALNLAADQDIIAVDRELLVRWMAGSRLDAIVAAETRENRVA